MKKINCIFVRKYIDNVNHTISDQRTKNSRYLAIDQINPGCEWVFNGEGIPTIKWDGTAVLIQRAGDVMQVYQRYATKNLCDDESWISCDNHPENGKNLYWIPATDKWVLEAAQTYFDRQAKLGEPVKEGTYEAIGPKINGNRYKADNHVLVKHGWNGYQYHFGGTPLTYEGIKFLLKGLKLRIPEMYEDWVYHEGLVFHHPDGRMAKIRRADFAFE